MVTEVHENVFFLLATRANEHTHTHTHTHFGVLCGELSIGVMISIFYILYFYITTDSTVFFYPLNTHTPKPTNQTLKTKHFTIIMICIFIQNVMVKLQPVRFLLLTTYYFCHILFFFCPLYREVCDFECNQCVMEH